MLKFCMTFDGCWRPFSIENGHFAIFSPFPRPGGLVSAFAGRFLPTARPKAIDKASKNAKVKP